MGVLIFCSKVGHMIKLGSSTRTFLLTGPEKDTEAESESTVTELKQMRFEELKKREEEAARSEIELESTRKREEEHGVDWGMGKIVFCFSKNLLLLKPPVCTTTHETCL